MNRIVNAWMVMALGGLLQAGCLPDGDDDGDEVDCTSYSNPAAPQLVPARLSDLAKGVQAVVDVQNGTNVTLTLNLLSDSTKFSTAYNPSQCPQLSATVTLNGEPMAAESTQPDDQADSCGDAYLCTSPSFFTQTAQNLPQMSTMAFVLTDSSGSYEINIVSPIASIDGSNVLSPNHVVSVDVDNPSDSPTTVAIGAPEVGVVFKDVTALVQPTATGFSFVMPATDLSVSSSTLVDQDWDAGASSCAVGGAAFPCGAALEMTFPVNFAKCDFSGCNVQSDSMSFGAPSGIVLLPVTLESDADAGIDASDGG